MYQAVITTVEALVYGALAVVLLPTLAFVLALLRYVRLGRSLRHAGRVMGVRWWDTSPILLVCGVVVVVYVVGDPPVEGEPGRAWFLLSAALLLMGGLGAALALGYLDEYRELSGGTEAAGSAGEGPTVLTGEATVHEGQVRGALSDEPALVTTLRVTEPRGSPLRRVAAERHYERDDARFALDDGTGTVVVAPSGGAVRLWGPNEAHSPVTAVQTPEETHASAVEAVCDRLGLNADRERTYTERRLTPGTDVTVLGTISRDPTVRYPLVDDGERRLVVFLGDIDAVRSAVAGRARFGTALGLLGLAAGVPGTLVTAGVL